VIRAAPKEREVTGVGDDEGHSAWGCNWTVMFLGSINNGDWVFQIGVVSILR
jgi:hypothetical protein